MKKIFTFFVLTFLATSFAQAQQDAMYTKYMFNSLTYNPAYAGSNGHMSIGILHRSQWWALDGGPMTQSFTIHTPLAQDRIGVGLSVTNDIIGATGAVNAQLSYAYRFSVGAGHLAVGVQGGIMNWRADWNKLTIEDEGDEAFGLAPDDRTPNYWLPNFGAGLYYHLPNFYVGMSVPHLINQDLRNDAMSDVWARQYRHYFFTVGGAIELGSDALVFKPSLLVKNVGLFDKQKGENNTLEISAPTEFDIDLSLLFQKQFWVGASFRSSIEMFNGESSFDSVDFWAAYFMKNGLRIGAAYDFTLTKLRQPSGGSAEVFLGYEFVYKEKKIVTPRYF